MIKSAYRTVYCLLTLMMAASVILVSCKIPEEKDKEKKKQAKEPAKSVEEPEQSEVPYTSKIKYDIWAEKDEEKPSIIHVTARPFVDDELLADHPGGRLEIEVFPRRGIKLIKGRHRYRVFLRDINDTKIELDIRKDTFGVSKVDFKGQILASNGLPLIEGDSSFKILAHPGEKVILDQEKIQEYEKEHNQGS